MALGACGNQTEGSRTGTGRTGAGTTTITGARIFDGKRVIDDQVVVLDGPRISAVGGRIPRGSKVIDADGATLLPSPIDSHVHTTPEFLGVALRFGVTTELYMGNELSADIRKAIAGREDVADFRSPGVSITAPNGHPAELFPQPRKHDYCRWVARRADGVQLAGTGRSARARRGRKRVRPGATRASSGTLRRNRAGRGLSASRPHPVPLRARTA